MKPTGSKSKPPRPSYQLPILLGLVGLSLILGIKFYTDWRSSHPGEKTVITEVAKPADSASFAELKVRLKQSLEQAGHGPRVLNETTWQLEAAPGQPVVALQVTIKTILKEAGLSVQAARIDPASGKVSLEVGSGPLENLILELLPKARALPSKGRIAIIIDDCGARWDSKTEGFVRLNVPLTVSVIPSMPSATTVAEQMKQAGCQVLVHLAMEPFDARFRNEPMMLKTGAADYEIRQLLDQALHKVPGAAGLNNHMGSKATSHTETMKTFLKDLKRRGLFFVDSRTIATTVAYGLAREMKIPSTERQVFIDPEDKVSVIETQLRELARVAAKRGEALGIGHCRANTLAVMKRVVPELKEQGYQFVFVSDIVQ